jgi:hypothetical protein
MEPSCTGRRTRRGETLDVLPGRTPGAYAQHRHEIVHRLQNRKTLAA